MKVLGENYQILQCDIQIYIYVIPFSVTRGVGVGRYLPSRFEKRCVNPHRNVKAMNPGMARFQGHLLDSRGSINCELMRGY